MIKNYTFKEENVRFGLPFKMLEVEEDVLLGMTSLLARDLMEDLTQLEVVNKYIRLQPTFVIEPTVLYFNENQELIVHTYENPMSKEHLERFFTEMEESLKQSGDILDVVGGVEHLPFKYMSVTYDYNTVQLGFITAWTFPDDSDEPILTVLSSSLNGFTEEENKEITQFISSMISSRMANSAK